MTLTEAPLRSQSGLSTTVAWRRNGHVSYALEGNISVSAQAASWMAELMGLPDAAALTALSEGASGDSQILFRTRSCRARRSLLEAARPGCPDGDVVGDVARRYRTGRRSKQSLIR